MLNGQATDATVQVSVVIPTHGRRELLARLLASLEAQTVSPSTFEVLIIHNHTEDGTEAMAQAWCARQAFAAQYFRKNYNGPGRSRDFGARAAKGRILAFIDDDCVATPQWLQSGLSLFDEADAQSNAHATVSVLGLVQGQTTPMPDQRRPFLSKTIEIRQASVFFETCNIFYRRSAFDQVGGFSEDFIDRFYGEDTDLGWKLKEAGFGSRFAPDALVHHEIFQVSFYKWLAEPLYFKNLPYLVKKYPKLRQHMYLRYFVSRDSCLFTLLPLALLLSPSLGTHAWWLTLPYFAERLRSGQHIRQIHFKVVRALVGVVRGAFSLWALIQGSWRAKTLLL